MRQTVTEDQTSIVFELKNQRQIQIVLHVDEDRIEVFAIGKKHGDLVINPRSGNSIHITTSGPGVQS